MSARQPEENRQIIRREQMTPDLSPEMGEAGKSETSSKRWRKRTVTETQKAEEKWYQRRLGTAQIKEKLQKW